MQYGTIKIGQVIKLMVDSFGEDALMDSLSENEKAAWHKKINRLISEREIRIDTIRDFEILFHNYLEKAKIEGYIQQLHIGMIETLYWDLLALITATTPYSVPTKNEVQLQIMWCLASLFHEAMDFHKNATKMDPKDTDTTIFSIFDFWKIDNYEKEVDLLNNTFRALFTNLKDNYTQNQLYTIWNEKRAEIDGIKGEYSKSVNDWLYKNKIPTWKMLKPIFESALENANPTDAGNYLIFKFHLFTACFMKRFFNSLEEQKLIDDTFYKTVQEGFLSFYQYMFVKKSFKTLKYTDTINFMFMCLRGLCIPNTNAPISDLIREAFSKEEPGHPDFYTLQKIAFVDSELAIFPEYEKFVKRDAVPEDLLSFLSKESIGNCSDFFYNWFKGRYLILNNKIEEGYFFYKNAFEYKYYAGQFLPDYLREILAVMKQLKCKKPEQNAIIEFAHAVQYSINNDNLKYQKLNRNIDCDFKTVFPTEAFFLTD